MNFKDLKSRLTSADHMKDVAGKIASTQTSYIDDRYWKLDVDKSTGNGQATIRFMCEPEGEDLPVVKMYKHNFKDKKTGKKSAPIDSGIEVWKDLYSNYKYDLE